MQCSLYKSQLLKPLQLVCGSLGGRLAAPILSHVLLEAQDNTLTLTATDTEVQMSGSAPLLAMAQPGEVAVSGRKFLEIIRMLPEAVPITLRGLEGRFEITAARSRFSLLTLPVESFPSFEPEEAPLQLRLAQALLHALMDATAFAMAHQDVRCYLNGMLFEMGEEGVRTVATDGHRLAFRSTPVEGSPPRHTLLLPRKAVFELLRLLDPSDPSLIQMRCGEKVVTFEHPALTFSSRLVEGKFPQYQSAFALPFEYAFSFNVVQARQALMRSAVLSHERLKSVRWLLGDDELKILTTNSVDESAEEMVEIEGYTGPVVEIGFNVSYVLDLLNALKEERCMVKFTDPCSGVLFYPPTLPNAQYVVMPLRL